MCDFGLSAAIIGAIAAVGTTAYSVSESKKAEKRQQAAQEQLAKQTKQQQNTISKTAQQVSINDTESKRTLSSLRIPASNNAPSVNTGGMTAGLNIPM